jgi:hypothetical protein
MDLGLDQLSDDQLLDLLQEVLGNLAGRDGYVRNLAQSTIFSEAERLKAMRESMRDAVDQAKAEYISKLKSEIQQAVAKDLEDPATRLVSADQEQFLVAEGTLEARLQLIDDAIQEMQQGLAGHFAFEIVGNRAILRRGTLKIEHSTTLEVQELRELGHLMYKVLNR